jgi:hypothetical protein
MEGISSLTGAACMTYARGVHDHSSSRMTDYSSDTDMVCPHNASVDDLFNLSFISILKPQSAYILTFIVMTLGECSAT